MPALDQSIRLGIVAASLLGCAAPRPEAPHPVAAAPAIASPAPTVPTAPPAPVPAPTIEAPPPAQEPDGRTTNAGLAQALRGLVAGAAPAGPVRIRVVEFGRSRAGIPLQALWISAAANAGAPLPNVLLLGQQHGDEPAGAEALLTLARRAAQGDLAGVLARVNLVLVPRLNPDGAATAQRANGDAIDLDADHLLLRSNEAWALAGLMRALDPELVVDLRSYDATAPAWQAVGATPRADVMIDYAASPAQAALILRAADEWFTRPMLNAFGRAGLKWNWFYTPGTGPAGPTLSMDSARPDTERNVTGLRGAVSLMIASRSAGPEVAQRRASERVLLVAVDSLLLSAAARGQDLLRVRGFERSTTAARACRGEVVIEARPTRAERKLPMRDGQTGAEKTVSVEWVSSRILDMRRLRSRPCGYWIAATATGAVDRLRQLGVEVTRLAEPVSVLGSLYRERDRPTSAGFEADTVDALVEMPAGSHYVSLGQPLANLVVAALEPDTGHGFFAHRLLDRLEDVARVRAPPQGMVGLPAEPAAAPP